MNQEYPNSKQVVDLYYPALELEDYVATKWQFFALLVYLACHAYTIPVFLIRSTYILWRILVVFATYKSMDAGNYPTNIETIKQL